MDYSKLDHNNRNNFVLKINFSNKEDGKLEIRCWSLSEEEKNGGIFKGKSEGLLSFPVSIVRATLKSFLIAKMWRGGLDNSEKTYLYIHNFYASV